MKNPFDDNPLHDDGLSDIFGNDLHDPDPNAHDDGFQHHAPDFQDNSHLHDLHHDPFQSEWGANHSDHLNPSDPSHTDPHGNFHHSEVNDHFSKLDPEHLNTPASNPMHHDPHGVLHPGDWNSGHHDPHGVLHPGDWNSGHHDPHGVLRPGEWGAEHHGSLHPRDWGAEHHSSLPRDWGAEHHEPHRHHEHHAHHSDNHHRDWSSPMPDAHQYSDDPDCTPQPDEHTFASAAASSVLHFESSSDSNKHPYITVSDSGTGHVYLNGDKDIGRIDGHTVYNSENWNCGHWTTDGKVYDYHDNLVGWVHPDGHVYAKGSSGDLEVYQTDKGVAGGAAYLLLVWCGGQTHI